MVVILMLRKSAGRGNLVIIHVCVNCILGKVSTAVEVLSYVSMLIVLSPGFLPRLDPTCLQSSKQANFLYAPC